MYLYFETGQSFEFIVISTVHEKTVNVNCECKDFANGTMANGLVVYTKIKLLLYYATKASKCNKM